MYSTCGSGRLAWFLFLSVEKWEGTKTMTAWSALHEATALIARTKWRQVNRVSRSPQRPAGEPNNAAGGLQKAERNGGEMKCKDAEFSEALKCNVAGMSEAYCRTE